MNKTVKLFGVLVLCAALITITYTVYVGLTRDGERLATSDTSLDSTIGQDKPQDAEEDRNQTSSKEQKSDAIDGQQQTTDVTGLASDESDGMTARDRHRLTETAQPDHESSGSNSSIPEIDGSPEAHEISEADQVKEEYESQLLTLQEACRNQASVLIDQVANELVSEEELDFAAIQSAFAPLIVEAEQGCDEQFAAIISLAEAEFTAQSINSMDIIEEWQQRYKVAKERLQLEAGIRLMGLLQQQSSDEAQESGPTNEES